jgi:hypothetical protein
MRPSFPDLPERSQILSEDPATEVGKLTNDISLSCQ